MPLALHEGNNLRAAKLEVWTMCFKVAILNE